ncbi:MAG: DUF192 domain-containing protein [Ignavibacteria bacterium]|nr:DUF192 domain-containing protein [Ignavibacteria bacterium]
MGKNRRKVEESQPQPRKRPLNRIAAVVMILIVVGATVLIMTRPTERKTPEGRPREASPVPTAYEFKKQGDLRFLDAQRKLIVAIDIELALDEQTRELGLMYRDRMGENQGMLFVFDTAAPRSFWMKNTILSLDILFVDAENRIVTIHKYTKPYSEESYPSTSPAQFAVEVNSGFTDKHGIRVGDFIDWRGFF